MSGGRVDYDPFELQRSIELDILAHPFGAYIKMLPSFKSNNMNQSHGRKVATMDFPKLVKKLLKVC